MSNSRKVLDEIEQSKSSSELSFIENTKSLNKQPSTISISGPLTPSLQFHKNSQQGPVAGPSSEMLTNMFFNPLFHHSNMINPISFNYLNQGIFVPRPENNQFSFIPGNIGYETNELNNRNFHRISPELQYDNIKITCEDNEVSSNLDSSPKQIYFVPTKETKPKNIQDELKDNNYETYLVPVKIKKEINGNIELLPQSDTEMISQQLNPDQLNILKKIYLLKNQKTNINVPDKSRDFTKMVKIDEQFIDKCDETSADGGKHVFSNIQDKTQGFMMVRFNKSVSNNKSKAESDNESVTVTSNSLKLSTSNKLKVRENKSNIVKIKKNKKNVHTLKLSAQTNKNVSISNPQSRFRRLRLDDKKSCWHANTTSCIDTKMREIPSNILDLSEMNSISISYTIFSLFNQQKMSNDVSERTVSCEHSGLHENQLVSC